MGYLVQEDTRALLYTEKSSTDRCYSQSILLGEPLVYSSIETPIVAIKHIYISIKPGCFGLLKALRYFDKEQHREAGCMAKRKKRRSRSEISVYFELSARKAHSMII